MLDPPSANHSPSQEAILGLDNVALELPVAHLGSRALAALVDYVLLMVALTVGILAFFLLAPGFSLLDSDLGMWGLAFFVLAMVAAHWAYFAIFEIVLDGATPGKKLTGIRVVSRDGGRVGAGAVVLRTLVREVDIIAGVLFMALDSLSRRVGDRLAGTLVVHDKAQEDIPLEVLPRGWGAGEAQVVEALLARREEMDGARAADLAGRLLRLIRHCDPSFLPRELGRELEEIGHLPAMPTLAAAFRRDS